MRVSRTFNGVDLYDYVPPSDAPLYLDDTSRLSCSEVKGNDVKHIEEDILH